MTRILTTLVLAATLGSMVTPNVLAEGRVIEQSLEVRAAVVALPAAEGSSLTVGLCAGCRSRNLGTTLDTKFIIDEEAVTLAEFRAFAASNPNAQLVVAYLGETNVVTRIFTWSNSGR
jgi:hypothetical protein